ncbi:diguanylate cyclase [Agarivorans sp. Z349TD_8]|uniref:diguanylate cyclase n=1 Tax=Agarivorans sp. Z349TD_8 TaxID=3421434 RepID=UPI003D7DDB8E
MPRVDHFSQRIETEWKRAQCRQASFSFYQSSDAESLARWASAFAEQQQLSLKLISLNQQSIYSPYRALFALFMHQLPQSNYSVAALVKLATDFVPLQQCLSGLLTGKINPRTELLLMDDLYFEQRALQQAILRLVELLLDEPCILVMTGWHFASASAIQTLIGLVNHQLKNPIMVMIEVDTQYALSHRQDDEAWEGFLDWLDDMTLLYRVPPSQALLKPIWHYREQGEVSMQLVAENIQSMAWPEAEAAARVLLDAGDVASPAVEQLQLQLAEALLYQGELNEAVTELELVSVSEASPCRTDDRVKQLNLLSLSLVQQQRFEEAMQYSEAAIEVAEQAGHGRLLAQSWFVNYYAHDKSSTPVQLKQFELLDKTLHRYQMNCSRLYALRNYYTYLRFYEELEATLALEFTQKAVNLARKIGHHQGIAASYHSKGIIYSYVGRYHATFRCFAISSRIREALGEASERVRMYNGTGYFNTLLEKYPEAQQQYLAAYNIIRHSGDYSELVATLYNFAWLYFCTRDYQQASDVLEQLVRVCRIRQMTHFPFRNLYDVFSLKGFCHAKLGELARAQQCLERMQGLPFKPSSTGEFLMSLLQGALYVADERLDEARQVFEAAPAILGDVVDMDTRLLPQCSCELLEVYSRQGDWLGCERLLSQSLAMCELLDLPHFSQIFIDIQQVISQRNVFYSRQIKAVRLLPVQLYLEDLVRNAKQGMQLRQVQQRLREMQLISRMQSLPERFDNSQDLVNESLKLVCGNFTVQRGMIHYLNVDQWQAWTEVGHSLPDSQVQQYLHKIKEHQNIWVENSFFSKGEDGKRATYNSLVCLPIFVDGHLYAAMTLCNVNSNRYFDRQDQDTLQLVSRQLGSQLQQLRHRENLLKMSTTDPLTGLFNRQALLARLEQELVICAQQSGSYYCSLAYIDLDNFKLVNDLLGHDVGDRVLCAFAEILIQTMRASDIVARWGGDEFVVVFPNVSHSQAKISAERLLDNLQLHHYLKPQLIEWADSLELVENLPDLTCSIGITDCGGMVHTDLNEAWLLKQADKALYKAKAEGKGRVKVISR